MSRETKFSGANGDKEIFIFPVQLSTRRIGLATLPGRSKDGFSRPVPRQPAHLHTQAESGAYLGIPPEFHGGVHL